MTLSYVESRAHVVKNVLRRYLAKPEQLSTRAFVGTLKECRNLLAGFPRLFTPPVIQALAQDCLLFSGQHNTRFTPLQLYVVAETALAMSALSFVSRDDDVRQAFALQLQKVSHADGAHAPRRDVLVLSAGVLAFIQDMHTDPIAASAVYLENES